MAFDRLGPIEQKSYGVSTMSKAKFGLLVAVAAIAIGVAVYALQKSRGSTAATSIEQSSVAKREAIKQMTPLCLAGMDCPANASAGDKR
ncbi:hypothetical protein QWC_31121 [Achromobacter marplatensis]|nr:hypothetical protein QWC_31121 [Achromobacter marplatensis]